MKTLLNLSKTLLIIGCFLLMLPETVHAQTAQKAKYDPTTKVISLDEKVAFGYLFQLDLSPMKFPSQAAAEEFFSNWTTELVSFQVNFEKRSANVILNTRSQPTWLAKEWNAYLAKLPKQ